MSAGTVITKDRVAIVAIGRNEGERLRACLDSLPQGVGAVVYVDSGSTDGSLELARERGVEVVELDLSVPFTAARARNAGIEHAVRTKKGLLAVHTIDGDCALEDGWLEASIEEMNAHERCAVVCGNRREKFPEATVYNRLCDIEWGHASGEVRACGGDALIRLDAFVDAGGYDPTLIAGEEPEMCFRMREKGWSIRRLDRTMTWHDADVTRFGQWWKRAVRSGYACAEGAAMHGNSPERYNVRRVRGIALWGLVLPIVCVATTLVLFPLGVLSFGIFAMQWARLLAREARRRPIGVALPYATSLVVDKFAQLVGVFTYLSRRVRGEQGTLIEYKGAEATGESS